MTELKQVLRFTQDDTVREDCRPELREGSVSSHHTTAGVLSVRQLIAEMADLLRVTLGDAAAGEARDLIAALHDAPRHWAIVNGEASVSSSERDRALHAAARRAGGAPLAYAAGRASFRHLTLHVDERVLIPRPETELLVDIVLDKTKELEPGTIVDAGTGSGAIALALATEGHHRLVIGTDISLDALNVARRNVIHCAATLRASVEMRHGSLLAPVPERRLSAVVSNPPYIAYEEAAGLPSAVRDWEPSVALFTGAAGMATTAQLVREAAGHLMSRGVLALEVDVRRAGTVAELVATHGAYDDVQVLLDLTGRERFVVARKREEQG